MSPVKAIARLTLTRLRRSRVRWLIGAMCLLPVVIAVLAVAMRGYAHHHWRDIGELSLRSLTLLMPTLLMAGAVGDEQQGKTYSYLWSRPIPRPAIIHGKLLATLPVMAAAMTASLTAAFLLVLFGSRGEAEWSWLLRTLGAGLLGLVCASAVAAGLGSLFPKRPLVAVLAWVLLFEQLVPEVPAAQNLMTLHHVRVLAALPGDDPQGSVIGSVIGLIVLTAIWLGVASWRVNRVELSGEG